MTNSLSRQPRASSQKFMRDMLKIISDPQHPLHFLVEPKKDKLGQVKRSPQGNIVFDWRKTERITKSGRKQRGRYQGSNRGQIVQAGHLAAYATGQRQMFVLEDADINQVTGQTIESKGALSYKVGVVIEGVPVDLSSAQQWSRDGDLQSKHITEGHRIYPPGYQNTRSLTDRGTKSQEIKARATEQNRNTTSRGINNQVDTNLSNNSVVQESPKTDRKKPFVSSVESLPSKTNVRPRLSKISFRFLGGLVIGILQDIAFGLFVSYFEAQVNRETQKRIKVAWKDKVYPKVEYQIRNHMKLSVDGQLSKNQNAYIGVRWTLITRELAEDASDVIVYFTKFAAGEPGFGEIYHDLEVQKEDKLLIYTTKKKLTGERRKRKRDPKRKDLFRYLFLQWILVHDPKVIRIADRLKKELQENLATLEKIKRNYILVDQANRFSLNITNIEKAIQQIAYHVAIEEILTFKNKVSKSFATSFANKATELIDLIRTLWSRCFKAMRNILDLKSRLDLQQRVLLSSYLGQNIELLDIGK